MNILELMENYPAAYSALPEPYQSDNCLEFIVSSENQLLAYPKGEEKNILGDWCAVYCETIEAWVLDE